MAVIGIDLGTTNSLAAYWKNGETKIIPNSVGNSLTPSVVSIDENNVVLVGNAAKERINYEIVEEQFKNKKVNTIDLLFPINIELNNADFLRIKENLNEIHSSPVKWNTAYIIFICEKFKELKVKILLILLIKDDEKKLLRLEL